MAIKRVPAKKAAPRKTVAPKKTEEQMMADEFVSVIKSGMLDFAMEELDDAVTHRLREHTKQKEEAAKKAAPKTAGTKTVPQPTRKTAASSTPKFTPEVGKLYAIDAGVKTHGGKKGKFLRFYKGEESKSVIDFGDTKGVIPTKALKKVLPRRRK
jgi:hypothetical protein